MTESPEQHGRRVGLQLLRRNAVDLALAEGLQAGDASMIAAGRREWNVEDTLEAIVEQRRVMAEQEQR